MAMAAAMDMDSVRESNQSGEAFQLELLSQLETNLLTMVVHLK